MIPAHKRPLFDAWFTRNARARVRRTFSRLGVAGREHAAQARQQGPVIVVSNHTSWWDPLIALILSHDVLGSDGYAMMDAANLRTHPFFGMVGAFGVDLNDPADGARSLRYASKLLHDDASVWLFPQGREVPVTVRPLGFQPGSAALARLAKRASVLPVGIRYEFGNDEKPAAYASFGEPVGQTSSGQDGCIIHEKAVVSQLEHIERALAARDTRAFEPLLQSPTPLLEAWSVRALAAYTRLALR